MLPVHTDILLKLNTHKLTFTGTGIKQVKCGNCKQRHKQQLQHSIKTCSALTFGRRNGARNSIFVNKEQLIVSFFCCNTTATNDDIHVLHALISSKSSAVLTSN